MERMSKSNYCHHYFLTDYSIKRVHTLKRWNFNPTRILKRKQWINIFFFFFCQLWAVLSTRSNDLVAFLLFTFISSGLIIIKMWPTTKQFEWCTRRRETHHGVEYSIGESIVIVKAVPNSKVPVRTVNVWIYTTRTVGRKLYIGVNDICRLARSAWRRANGLTRGVRFRDSSHARQHENGGGVFILNV